MWKGVWKGDKKTRSRRKKERESDVTDDSMANEGSGRRQVKKFFIEAEYHGVSISDVSRHKLTIRKPNMTETLE